MNAETKDAGSSPVERGVRPGAQWDDARCTELKMLQSLVREVATINNGNCCLQRIALCIDLAEKLDTTDYTNERSGFIRWLHELAIEDRFGPQA